jgi:hypothetical protein
LWRCSVSRLGLGVGASSLRCWVRCCGQQLLGGQGILLAPECMPCFRHARVVISPSTRQATSMRTCSRQRVCAAECGRACVHACPHSTAGCSTWLVCSCVCRPRPSLNCRCWWLHGAASVLKRMPQPRPSAAVGSVLCGLRVSTPDLVSAALFSFSAV